MKKYHLKTSAFLLLWLVAGIIAFSANGLFLASFTSASAPRLATFAGVIACILAGAQFLKLLTQRSLARSKRPAVEALMVGRLYDLLAGIVIILALGYGFGKLGAFGAIFAAFGGMFLGFALQAPVSGFAAWLLVSLKRPFRPGDRIQLPNLGMTGDVKDIGLMYTVLNQVGGTIGSEEAVGRYILVPNAMLFSQVVINYTVLQESPYMLDEVVVRITYDSDWQEAEKILIDAAVAVTADIIEATGVQPYIRSDMYDYGVFLRLRYQTRVNDRAQIANELTKLIFTGIQGTSKVDVAIPFIYSNRAALEKRDDGAPKGRFGRNAQEIDIARVRPAPGHVNPADVEQLAQSIATQGLLQPIVVAGQLRFEACKQLGWKSVPAIIQNAQAQGASAGSGEAEAKTP